MTATPTPLAGEDQIAWFTQTFDTLSDAIGQAVLGKREVIRLALTALASSGHLLLEDLPGTGKTSLARALANTISGSHSRIQFTPDLLPSDLTGVTIYDPARQSFDFHAGPVFANVVLADEINRASPKTQSALLEVMEENKVTVDGVTRPVPEPFLVVATQNPVEQAGTYRLPEAQLDRFLLRTAVGYPDADALVDILSGTAPRDRARLVEPVITGDVVAQMRQIATRIHVSPEILRYVAALADASRTHRHLRLGLSVRGCLALTHAAKTWAAGKGRNYVVPDDVTDLAVPVMAHRLLLDADAQFRGVEVEDVVAEILSSVRTPTGAGRG